jgi:hypothetical protein
MNLFQSKLFTSVMAMNYFQPLCLIPAPEAAILGHFISESGKVTTAEPVPTKAVHICHGNKER